LPTDPRTPVPGLIWVLVAEGRDGSLHGVMLAVPPTNVLADGIQAGVPVPAVVAGAAKIAKLRAVAVAEDARGNRLGETMINGPSAPTHSWVSGWSTASSPSGPAPRPNTPGKASPCSTRARSSTYDG